MMNTQITTPRSPIEFFVRRLIRILPMYYFCTLLYCLVYFVNSELFNTFEYSTSWLLASLTFTSGIGSFGYPIVLIGWTLEFEILFYGLLALTSIFLKSSFQVVTITIVFSVMVFFGVNSIVIEFILGMFCGLLSQRLKISSIMARTLVVLGVMTFLVNYIVDASGIIRVILFGIPSFFLLLGAVNLKPTTNHAAIVLGDSSYSTYLVQILTIPFFFKVVDTLSLTRISSEVLGLASIFFTVLIGHFLFWKIERYFDSQIYRRIRFLRNEI
jgi:exopolysaccharide production protein ExoZ